MGQYDAQEASIRRQQMIAKALRDSGNQGFDPAASAGRLVYARSPWEDINKVAQLGAASYLDNRAEKRSTDLEATKQADARTRLGGMLDTLTGKSDMQAQANPNAKLQDFSNISLRNPVTGATETANLGESPQAPMFTSPEKVETNNKRAAIAGILKGGDPEAAAAALEGPALAALIPKPLEPFTLGVDEQRYGPDGKLIATGKPKPAPVLTPFEEQSLKLRAADQAEERRHNAAIEASSRAAEQNKNFDPVRDEATVDLIGQGKANLAAVGTGRNQQFTADLYNAVMAKYPNFRADAYPTRAATQKAFSVGTEGRNVRSLNTAIAHLDTLEELSKARNTGDVGAINKGLAALSKQFGGVQIPSFEAARDMVSNEIVKAVVATGGTEADRQEAAAKFATALNDQQVHAVANTYRTLLGGQLGSLRTQYVQGTSLASDPKEAMEFFDRNFLTGRTKNALPTDPNDVPASLAGGAALPPANAKGWKLHEDAKGNKAYVGPNGEIEEAK